MTENDENNTVSGFDLNSKFMRVLLIIVTVFLIFAGPTYVSYLLFNILNLNYVASVAAGIALFTAGILLMLFLIRKKIIT
jgi:capsule polysaccharide export protein KpsE/RkpR